MPSVHGADEAALEKSLRELQPLNLDTAELMLKETKGILDRLGVAFFLRQGTCLGAVRDNAFIPWDDDLDIGSVLGLHGLTENSIDPVVGALKNSGYFVKVERNDHYIYVSGMKSSTRMD